MTQVHSSSGAMAPFVTPVSKGKAKTASQPDKKTAAPKPTAAKPAASPGAVPHAHAGKHGTDVTFGKQALHAVEGAAEFVGGAVLTGVEDVAEAAYYTVKAVGTGLVDAAVDLKDGVVAGLQGVKAGVEGTATAIGHGVIHAENALGDAWGVITQGMSQATSLATTLGTDASVVVTNVGTAATDVGVSANAVLAGVGSAARTAANYGSYVVNAGSKLIDELG
jgi:hypothetical protein